MLKRSIIVTALTCAMGLTANISVAADQERDQGRDRLQTPAPDKLQTQDQDRLRDQDIYGWQLMSPAERAEHRDKMRLITSREEREKYRMEHHMKMQERAKEKGVTLPDMPENKGRGMGPGGMGPGGGRGR